MRRIKKRIKKHVSILLNIPIEDIRINKINRYRSPSKNQSCFIYAMHIRGYQHIGTMIG